MLVSLCVCECPPSECPRWQLGGVFVTLYPFKPHAQEHASIAGMANAIVTLVLAVATIGTAQAAGYPSQWEAGVQGSYIFPSNDSSAALMPALGNGLIGLVAGESVAFQSGLFTGGSCPGGAELGAFDARDRANSNSAYGVTIPLLQSSFGTGSPSGGGSAMASSTEDAEIGVVWTALDVHSAAVYRTYNLSVPAGSSTVLVGVWEREYAHWTIPSLHVRELNLTVLNPATSVDVTLTCEWGSTASGTSWQAGGTIDHITSQLGTVKQPEIPGAVAGQVAVAGSCQTGSISLSSAAGSRTLMEFNVIASSMRFPNENLTAVAVSTMKNASAANPAELWESHSTAWHARWEAGRIEITPSPAGSRDAELAVSLELAPLPAAANASMYDILISVRPDWPLGLSPGSIATSGYNANRFWDQDTWVFPGMAVLQRDDVGTSLAGYRADPERLAGAALKASANGYQGLMYPWQSGTSGRELQCGIEGKFEHHITADVALGMVQMWALQGGSNSTEAMAWLADVAWPVLNGTAAYWTSRVSSLNTSDPAVTGLDILPALPTVPGKYDPPAHPLTIEHTTGPDEFHPNVSTSAYTNLNAAMNLAASATAAEALGVHDAPIAEWRDVASRLVVLYNSTGKYHPEFLGWRADDIAKQADTVMLQYPLEWPAYPARPESLNNDIQYYAAHTTASGPAMTWGVFVNDYLDLSNATGAASLFGLSYANIKAPFWAWFETPQGGCPHFITGAGGWLQTLMMGFGGLRIPHISSVLQGALPGSLRWAPSGPPPGASEITLHGVDVASCALRLSVNATHMSAQVLGDASASRACSVAPHLLPAAAGSPPIQLPATIPLQAVTIVA